MNAGEELSMGTLGFEDHSKEGQPKESPKAKDSQEEQ